jgi:hypothetical protein
MEIKIFVKTILNILKGKTKKKEKTAQLEGSHI